MITIWYQLALYFVSSPHLTYDSIHNVKLSFIHGNRHTVLQQTVKIQPASRVLSYWCPAVLSQAITSGVTEVPNTPQNAIKQIQLRKKSFKKKKEEASKHFVTLLNPGDLATTAARDLWRLGQMAGRGIPSDHGNPERDRDTLSLSEKECGVTLLRGTLRAA